jgi:hypothetical protein
MCKDCMESCVPACALVTVGCGPARLLLCSSMPPCQDSHTTACRVAAAAAAAAQAVVDRYRGLLAEYRAHRAELGSWLPDAAADLRRRPVLADARASGDASLVERFAAYAAARDRLLAETPLLRDALESAAAGSDGSGGGANANRAAPLSRSQAVSQYFAAVAYRQAGAPLRASASAMQGDEQLSSSGSNEQAPAVKGTGNAEEGTAPHRLLASAVGSSTPDAASGRAAAAALAAMAYKTRRSAGGGAMADPAQDASTVPPQQQRRLAVLQAESPPPPPGYGMSGSPSDVVPLAAVQTAAADVNAARPARRLDADTSLAEMLQGVPGGLGADERTPMFAAPRSIGAQEEGGCAPAAASAQQPQVTEAERAAAVLAAARAAAAESGAPVGEVLTARSNAYAGRVRPAPANGGLDDFLAGLAGTDSRVGGSKQQEQQEQQQEQQVRTAAPVRPAAAGRTGLAGDDGGLPVLPGDALPLPT